MSTVGSVTKGINTQTTNIFIRPENTDIKYVSLQDKSFNPSHNVLIEPATDGGVVAYTGSLNATLNGTLLLNSDLITQTGGYEDIATVNANTRQLPIETWKLKMVDFENNTTEFSFKGMLEVFEIVGPAEGATKCNIQIRIVEFDASTDIMS